MPITTTSFISAIDITVPTGSSTASLCAVEMQNLKKAFKQSLPNINSEMSASSGALNFLVGLTANLQTQLNNHSALQQSTSENVQTALNNLSASLNAALLGLSSTAVYAVTWGSVHQHWQTATPSAEAGDLWFEL